MIFKQSIELTLHAFTPKMLEKALKKIINLVTIIGVKYRGPMPMPRKIIKFIVNKSPHIDKKSREQFEIRYHTKFLIIEALPTTVKSLMTLDIDSGVDIKIKTRGL
jgi:small subunit ribosomal protein S10